MFVQVSQAVLENQFAPVDDSGMGGHLVDFTEQMAGNHDGHAVFLRKGADQLAHFLDSRQDPARLWVHPEEAGGDGQSRAAARPRRCFMHQGNSGRLFILLLFHADNMRDIINFFFRDAF